MAGRDTAARSPHYDLGNPGWRQSGKAVKVLPPGTRRYPVQYRLQGPAGITPSRGGHRRPGCKYNSTSDRQGRVGRGRPLTCLKAPVDGMR